MNHSVFAKSHHHVPDDRKSVNFEGEMEENTDRNPRGKNNTTKQTKNKFKDSHDFDCLTKFKYNEKMYALRN